MKTKITLLTAVFILSIISVNAQFTLPKTKTIKNIELKKGDYKNLKMLPLVNDGYISQMLDGRYKIFFTKGGVFCCSKTIKEALNAYPQKKLIVATGGNQGFVYEEMADGSVGKKIPNAQIAFRNANSTVTHYAHTNKYGRYKMGLLPEKYIISIKHKGYKSYSTAPGFTVINEKFSTFIIPLKKLSKYPLNRKTNNIIAVFNRKTNKLIDVLALNKKNKQRIGRRKDAILFYGETNGKSGFKNI